MRDAAPQTIFLSDYTAFGWEVESVALHFTLAPTATRVTARIAFAPKPGMTGPMFLHGEDLTLISARIDGVEVTPEPCEGGILVTVPEAPFTWEAEVEINPQGNTALEGLYLSNGMYCTQCEAEGFRKITYYPDRPDVMSTFTVRIDSDLPVRLSNGNPTASGDGWSEWQDPWPKPAYLFALVAGDLRATSGEFTTASGRDVDLNVWVRPGDEGKTDFALDALIRSMRWDEEVYGREYDLDVFNIVAVDDFNMGAMENKGLNIFNASAVLASPETATDGNFERIEAIIAHEYFHNWTGNRITCRDWFQLCLKEGLTVFRDAQFTADMRSAPVKRISDVIDLRARQFPEDQGPLSHPVRPASYQEINNFYTATIYEKGAEVIGMLKTLVGDQGYKAALDLYFERHDGQACTIEDWLTVFEDACSRDLSQFKRWYTQAGTPTVAVAEDYKDGTYTLTLRQSLPASATTPEPKPQVIPFAMGLLDAAGREVLATQVLELTEAEQSFAFDGLSGRPTLSPLRGFSAPVILDYTPDAPALLAHDTDPFTRWEAARTMARQSLLAMITDGAAPDADYIQYTSALLCDESLDPEFRVLLSSTPSQSELATVLHRDGITPDPATIHAAAHAMRRAKAEALAGALEPLRARHAVSEAYRPDAEQSGRRLLCNAALYLLTELDAGAAAQAQFDSAGNMTDQMAALACLVRSGHGAGALDAFEAQWSADRLVMDKWFGLQVIEAKPEDVAATVRRLTQHPDFTMRNPNRFRAVLGAMGMHHAGFHHASGAAYTLMADWLIQLDPLNPQTTARMCSVFQTWKRYDPDRQQKIKAELDRIAAQPGLSRDVTEMISRIRDS